jgi:hypothetical protein
VEKPHSTAHQELRIWSIYFKKSSKKSAIQGKIKLNKRSDFPLSVHLWSVNGPLTVHVMRRVIAHHQGADGNGKLRPQGMKHFDGFSDDFGDDFDVILRMILASGIIALKQGGA